MWFIKIRRLRVFFVCLVLVIALRAANLSAYETTKISGKITAAYTIRDSIVVEDNIGHVLFLSTSEGKNVNTGEHAFMDGAQIVSVSSADLIQGSGVHQAYIKFTKDSDTIYTKWEGKVTTVQATEGAPATSFKGIFAYEKGTGKFENIRGSGVYMGEFISRTEYFVEWRGTYTNLWKELKTIIDEQFGIDSHKITFLWKELKTVIGDQSGIDSHQITLEKRFVEDFDFDSLMVEEFIMALEERFWLNIPDDDAYRMNTVKDVLKYLVRNIRN